LIVAKVNNNITSLIILEGLRILASYLKLHFEVFIKFFDLLVLDNDTTEEVNAI
jgi:hypothetical protein